MVNRAEELITQLEAEIVKRDARIAGLEVERNRLLNNPKDVFKKMCDMALKQRDELEAQLLDVSAERNACQRARITATNGWRTECEDADRIFTALGIDIDAARTDGGSLRVTSVIAALKAQPSAGVPVPLSDDDDDREKIVTALEALNVAVSVYDVELADKARKGLRALLARQEVKS